MTFTEYRVSGTTYKKPSAVPKYLKVEEVEVEGFRGEGTNGKAVYVRTDSPEESLFVGFPEESVQVFLPVDRAKALRDYLNEAYPKDRLRIIRDKDRDLDSRWYEVAPDQFIYAVSLGTAQARYRRNPHANYSKFYAIEEQFGIYQLGYQD